MTIVIDQVKYILETYPETRDDDKLLWLAYCCVFHDLQQNLTTYGQFKNWYITDIPSNESITRCRRKLQAKNPSLRGPGYIHKQIEAEIALKNFYEPDLPPERLKDL